MPTSDETSTVKVPDQLNTVPSSHARSACLPPSILPHQDAKVLWLHRQLALAGVLDTQVLYGLGCFGGAAAIGSNAMNRIPDLEGSLRRVGLGELYAKHGFPHPTKDEVMGGFNAADGRLVLCVCRGWVGGGQG